MEFDRNDAARLSDYVSAKYGESFVPDEWLAYWMDVWFFILNRLNSKKPKTYTDLADRLDDEFCGAGNDG